MNIDNTTSEKFISHLGEKLYFLTRNNYSGIEPSDENKEFLSIISHNIKNPFGALLGYTELILDDYNELSSSEKILYLSEIRKSAKYSFRYLERFFEWIYYKTGKVEIKLENLNVREIITASLKKIMAEYTNNFEINFNIPESLKIRAINYISIF